MTRSAVSLSQRRMGISSTGLNGGENVITSAPENLKDGAKSRSKDNHEH